MGELKGLHPSLARHLHLSIASWPRAIVLYLAAQQTSLSGQSIARGRRGRPSGRRRPHIAPSDKSEGSWMGKQLGASRAAAAAAACGFH